MNINLWSMVTIANIKRGQNGGELWVHVGITTSTFLQMSKIYPPMKWNCLGQLNALFDATPSLFSNPIRNSDNFDCQNPPFPYLFHYQKNRNPHFKGHISTICTNHVNPPAPPDRHKAFWQLCYSPSESLLTYTLRVIWTNVTPQGNPDRPRGFWQLPMHLPTDSMDSDSSLIPSPQSFHCQTRLVL